MLERFKNMFEDSRLAKYIVWAGIFSLLTFLIEALHTCWLALRYIFKF